MRNKIRQQPPVQAALSSRALWRFPSFYNREEEETLIGILGQGLRLGFFVLQTICRPALGYGIRNPGQNQPKGGNRAGHEALPGYKTFANAVPTTINRSLDLILDNSATSSNPQRSGRAVSVSN